MRAFAGLGLLLVLGCLELPMRPDRPELDRFAPAPGPGISLEVTPLLMASKGQPDCGMVGAASCLKRVEQVHAAYLVTHGSTHFLVDSGLSSRAPEDLSHFSWTVRQEFGFDLQKGLGELLKEAGSPNIDFVLLTHVHWDHSGGLVDLPGVEVRTTAEDAAFIRSFHGEEPTVVPAHFDRVRLTTYALDGPPYENFSASHDVFGDGSVVVVPLPGHTPGSVGVFLNHVHGRRLFFIGDTVWGADGYRLPSEKPKPLSRLTDQDSILLSDTIWRVYHLHLSHPEVIIVPAHGGEALRAVRALVGG
jgi:glyoxylase-like metal-dependent hydrolase (beta-lactamase superfamily II)